VIWGLDTSFLVTAEIIECDQNRVTRDWIRDTLSKNDARLALSPQVLCEFIHIVTDPKRFQNPFSREVANYRAAAWWGAKEIVQVFPSATSVQMFLHWLERCKLGRKRILDTMLAATYFSNNIDHIASCNVRDFEIFGCFVVKNVY
jgi:predicted nucleic acid-binding protein